MILTGPQEDAPAAGLYPFRLIPVIIRSGAASCGASAEPGLVDTTAGGGIAGGASLQANHLYLMTDSRTVTASEGAVLLVRGVYTIA